MNEISCQCPETAPGSAPAWWYEPEELKSRSHAPHECPGDVNLQLYRRGDQELWLCSGCWLTGDVQLSRSSTESIPGATI